MRLVAVACMSVLVIGGCESPTRQEAARLKEAREASNAADEACTARYAASNEYQFLKDKLPPTGGKPPSMELLTNPNKPTEAESAVLLKLHKDYLAPCRQQTVENSTKISPAWGAAYATAFADADKNYARLVQRQESWGEYAQSWHAGRAKLQQALQDVVSNVNRDLAQSYAAEAQQRQALASAVSQFAYQQQVIAAMNRPVSVTCTRTGGIVNCTGY